MDYRMIDGARAQHASDPTKMSEAQVAIWLEIAEIVESEE